MIKLLKTFFALFSPYACKQEKQLYRVISKKNINKARLLELMQENVVVVSLFLEKYSRGYKNLRKFKRQKAYKNLERLKTLFLEEAKLQKCNTKDQLAVLKMIKYFLHDQKRYVYKESTFLGGLLVDSNKQKLVGDCNQIVTLYVYFFSLFFDIEDLKIKMPTGHVLLSWNSLDIETTTGAMSSASKQKHYEILELLAVNLLDISDENQQTHALKAKAMLKMAKLAYSISSNKQIVVKNLRAAQHNLALEYLTKYKFKAALAIWTQLADSKHIAICRTKAVSYYVDNHKFAKALKFSNRDKQLVVYTEKKQIQYLISKSRLKKALKIAEAGLYIDLKQFILTKMFNELAAQLPSRLDSQSVADHKGTIKQMLRLALQMHDSKLTQHCKKLLDL